MAVSVPPHSSGLYLRRTCATRILSFSAMARVSIAPPARRVDGRVEISGVDGFMFHQLLLSPAGRFEPAPFRLSFHPVKGGERAVHDVECDNNVRLPKDPLGDALQE